MRTERTGNKTVAWVFFRRNVGAVDRDIRRLKAVLHIDPRRDEYLLTFGSRYRPNEIALLTRSMQEIMTELAAGVDVPQEDLAETRATASRGAANGEPEKSPLIRIRSSEGAPADAFAAVRYRDRWFWVDDRDLRSKRVFMFLMIMSALSETRAVPQVPIVTIPTN